MILAFYAVSNSQNYERHTFDAIQDNKQKVLSMLSRLPNEQVRIYDTEHYGWGAVPSPNMADFENDYNDEYLDGGWWCIVLK